MADLSLKQLDDGLMKAVKLAAFTAGKSQRDFVIQVLSEAVNGNVASGAKGGKGVRRQLDNSRQVAESIAESPIARRVFKHDVAGCKVYKCGMCSSLGVKDSQRGLK